MRALPTFRGASTPTSRIAFPTTGGRSSPRPNYSAVEPRSERVARAFEIPILVAALLVIPVIVIEESSIGEPWKTLAAVLNWGIWLAFLAELVAMLAVVPHRWRWIRGHPLEVVVVVLTPPFLPASLQALRVFRLIRLVRILRLAQIMRRLFTFEGLRYAALLALVTLIGGGTAFASVEKEPTAWDGIWWALTTMTTVGYGDVFPETNAGRVIAIVVMTVGIGFGTIVIGAVAQRFVETEAREEVAELEEEVASAETDIIGELHKIGLRLERLEESVRTFGAAGR